MFYEEQYLVSVILTVAAVGHVHPTNSFLGVDQYMHTCNDATCCDSLFSVLETLWLYQ